MNQEEAKLKEFKQYLYVLGYRAKTIDRMAMMVSEFNVQSNHKALEAPREIKQEDIEYHYEYLHHRPNQQSDGGLSEKSIYTHVYALRVYFNYLQEQQQIKVHPMSSLWFKSPEYKPRDIVSKEEIEQLYQTAVSYKERTMLGLYYGCGLRKQEGEDVNSRDVHFKDHLLYVREGKFKKRRVVPMAKRVSEDIKQYYYYERKTEKEQEALVLNETGTRMRGHSYRDLLLNLIARTKDIELQSKSIGLHSLRHSIGSHLLEAGVSLEYVRDFLGHSHIETTQYYTRVSTEMLKISPNGNHGVNRIPIQTT